MEALSKKRSAAKGKVTYYINLLAPLLPLRAEEAQSKAVETEDFYRKLLSAIETFKNAHKVYAEALENATDEADMDQVVSVLLKYESDVEQSCYATIEKWKLFHASLKIPPAKSKFNDALNNYKAEFSSATSLCQEAKGAVYPGDSEFLACPADEAKLTLAKAFFDLVKVRAEFKRVLEDAGENVDESLAAGVEAEFDTGGERFRSGFMSLRNKLAIIVNGQAELRSVRAAGPISSSSGASAMNCPVKLEKAETVKFSGRPRDFVRFRREFEEIVIPRRSDTEIGLRLKQSIPDKHKHLLQNFELSEHVAMMEELTDHFGTSEKVICSVVAEVEKLKMPQEDKGFVKFVETVEAADRDLDSMDLSSQIANEAQIAKLVKKFPSEVKSDWLRIVREENLLKSDTATRYRRMMKFLTGMKGSVSYNLSLEEFSSNKSSSYISVVTGKTLSASAAFKEEKPKFKLRCLACEKKGNKFDHRMGSCEQWKKLSYRDKRALVKCLKHPFQSEHDDAECEDSVGKCYNCDEVDIHHTLMCDKKHKVKSSLATSKSASSGSDVLLKTMYVKVGELKHKVGLIQDTGSTDNYVSTRLVSELKLKPVEDVVLEIEGINTTKTIDSQIFHVPLIDINGKIHKIECYSLKEITADSKPIEKKAYRKICRQVSVHPNRVKRPTKIDLLLSARNTSLMSDNHKGGAGDLRLYTGVLGMAISGKTNLVSSEHTTAYPTRATPIVTVIKKAKLMKTMTDKQILNHFKEESIGVECSPKCGSCQCGKCSLDGREMSIKDEKEYKKFKENMYLDEKGTPEDQGPYWRTNYPWKIPREELIDNKEAVLGVMRSTERKLAKDPAWRDIYEQQLRDLVANKFARLVSEEELESWKAQGGKTYHISHQMALNPASKSSPIRTVFNSSQTFKGYSLNSSWDLGPDVTGNLNGILYRLRENIVGSQGDVKKMYYNIRVTKEEEFMQLFLWKFKGEDKIQTLAMTRLVMGSKPSANSSQIALRETAFLDNNDVKYPAAVKALVKNSYVDNTFVGNETHEAVYKDIEAVETVAKQGGFFYKPWVVSGQDVGDQMVLNTDEVEDDKALGVMWDVKRDLFYIKVGASGKKIAAVKISDVIANPSLKLNLRICLSFHAKAFDPLGLILPLKMKGNILFRNTLQFLKQVTKDLDEGDKKSKKLPWDFDIEGQLKEKWIEYFEMLVSAENVKFPRAIKPVNVKPGTSPSLVTFSDGNEECYGAVCYVLWVLEDDTREARMIMSKAKLAPLLSKGEVVKNELSGATFAARLKNWILQNADLTYGDHIPFLDSRIVQAMVKRESYELNTFTGLRVKEIASKTDISSWRHIPSKDNYVADILTRGETPDKLGPGSEWQCGPAWLTEDSDKWPVTEVITTKEERDIVKSFERVTKSMIARVKTDTELHLIDQVIVNCGSLVKAINVLAVLLRLRGRAGVKFKNLKFHKMDIKAKCDNSPVTATEHSEAFKLIISHVQENLEHNKYQGFDLEEVEETQAQGKLSSWSFSSLGSRISLPASDLRKTLCIRFQMVSWRKGLLNSFITNITKTLTQL